ncbi:MAG: ChrR family anti-sigma-E factor [Rhodospirillaceae bacterium]|nr:ChrR family anti-sigma-E factor [Rhodospirillaceae bacterium]
MALHHPESDTLWAYAAGTLDEASSVLVATHLALCPHCRGEVTRMETVGGELLDDLGAAAVSATTIDSVMAQLDGPVSATSVARKIEVSNADTTLPRPLRDYLGAVPDIKWRKLTTGVQYVDLPVRSEGRRARLLKIAPGTKVPSHGHGGEEMTMVLAGGYTDEFGSYARGDVETADTSQVHQPIADPGEDCICLTVTRGALIPSVLFSLFSRILQLRAA